MEDKEKKWEKKKESPTGDKSLTHYQHASSLKKVDLAVLPMT
jgi:hypothetical protein